jgi:hypothetical protein
VYWLILAVVLGAIFFCLYRAWGIWQTHFANRHEFDADHLALLMAQREEIEQPVEPTRTSRPGRPRFPLPSSQPPSLSPLVTRPLRKEEGSEDRNESRHRKPLLDAAAQSVFDYLRSDLANYPVLALVDLASLLETESSNIPRIHVDFVVCKKDFSPALVIILERRNSGLSLDRAETLLRQHRLRVVRWRADALPDAAQMHQQIFKSKQP